LRDRMTRPERLTLDWMIGNREGDQGLSARSAEELYRIAPSDFAGHAMLTAYRQRRMDDAIERYRNVGSTEVCPWPGIWTQGSVAFHTLGRLEEELAVAREGLGRYPGHRGMMDIEVRAFAAFGRVEQVDSLLRVMAELAPDDAYDPNLRGVYAALELTAHGYPEAGRQIMERTVVDLSDSSGRNRARIHYWSGRHEEAIALYEGLLESEPENVEYLWTYGASLARLGRDREARGVIERLGRLDPTHLEGSHVWGQGLVAAALGERDEAVRLLQAAFDAGYGYFSPAHREPALAGLRGYPPFDALMAPR
jgi:tetratricopeptide (TPR) repeat protein